MEKRLEDSSLHSRDSLTTGSVLEVGPDLHGGDSHPDARPWSHTPLESGLKKWGLVKVKKELIVDLKLLLNAFG